MLNNYLQNIKYNNYRRKTSTKNVKITLEMPSAEVAWVGDLIKCSWVFTAKLNNAT